MSQYILALDQGTTSSRAIAFDRSGNIAALSQQSLPQHYPQAGWVEHDPLEIWDTQRRAAAEVIALSSGSIGEKLYNAKIYFQTADLFAWTAAIVLISAAGNSMILKWSITLRTTTATSIEPM